MIMENGVANLGGAVMAFAARRLHPDDIDAEMEGFVSHQVAAAIANPADLATAAYMITDDGSAMIAEMFCPLEGGSFFEEAAVWALSQVLGDCPDATVVADARVTIKGVSSEALIVCRKRRGVMMDHMLRLYHRDDGGARVFLSDPITVSRPERDPIRLLLAGEMAAPEGTGL